MKKNHSILIYMIILVLACAMTLWIGISLGDDGMNLSHVPTRDMNEEWTQILPDGSTGTVTITDKLEHVDDQNSVTVEHVVDWDTEKEANMLIFTSHTILDVYLEDQLIYSYGHENEKSRFFKVPGNCWHEIELTPQDEGKTIRIVSTSATRKHLGLVGRVCLTDHLSAGDFILRKNLVGVITTIVMFSFAVILFFIWFGMRSIMEDNRLLHLAMIAVGMVIWSMNDTQVSQLFFRNSTAYGNFTFELLTILLVPLINYFREGPDNRTKRMADKVIWIPALNFVVCNLLFFTGILDLSESLVITHIAVIAILSCFVIVYLSENLSRHKNFFGKMENLGFLALIGMLIFDAYRYYSSSLITDSIVFARIGCLVYFMSLGVGYVRNNFNMSLLGQKAAIYEHMAYHDKLTEQLNRTAYQEKLAELDEDLEKRKRSIILAIDINNLKTINDTKGHDAGDQYILQNVACIDHAFLTVADCYRIGGDEFSIIFQYEKEEEKQKFYASKEIMMGMLDEEAGIDFAYGSVEYDETIDKTILDTVKRADAAMYEQKRASKKERK